MNTKRSPILFLITMITIVSLACSSVSEFTATATPEPTPTSTPAPPPTPTPTPDVPLSTSGNPIVVEAGNLRLITERFEHPRGFVSFNVMDGWEVEYNDFSATMTDPNTGVMYMITVTNTGYELDADAYAGFRDANEEVYLFTEDFKEVDSGENPAIKLHYIEKTYTRSDGVEMYAFSLYQQFDSVIFTTELIGGSEFVQADASNPYKIMFDSFGQTITVFSDTASEFELYEQRWTYQAGDVNASLTVPWSWTFFADQSEGFQYANFYSPDFAAYAQFVRQDTVKLTKELGLDFAVSYLNIVHSNGGSDVQINAFGDMKEVTDGLYNLTWESKSAGKAGLLTYDIRVPNKLIMVVTIVQDLDLVAVYAKPLDMISNSYILNSADGQSTSYNGIANEQLKADTLKLIASYEQARGCSNVTLASGTVTTRPDQTNDSSWVERWQVNACGELRLYSNTFTPDGAGGTFISVVAIDQ